MVSHREIAAKALEAGLAIFDRKTNHVKLRRLICPKQAEQFAKEIRVLIDSQDAAKYLGLDRRVFEHLVRRKLVRGIRKTPRGHWKFTTGILDGFVELIHSKAGENDNGDKRVEEISAVAKRLSCKSEHIIELILTDSLQTIVKLNPDKTIQSIGVNIDEVKTVVDIPVELGCTRAKVVLKLKISRNTVKQLLKTGHLTEKIVRFPYGRRPVWIVTSNSMAEFQKKYVSLSQLARSLDRVPGPLAMHLTSRGIHPVESVREISNIYLKTQIPDL